MGSESVIDFLKEDPSPYIFTKEMVDQLINYEKSSLLIGIVRDVHMLPSHLKFILYNTPINDSEDPDKNLWIECNVWGTDCIKNAKSKLIYGNIILIDSALVKNKFYKSRSNINFDLHIYTNTIITMLKKCETIIRSVKRQHVTECTIKNCLEQSGVIELTGYLITPVKKIVLPKNNTLIQGCVAHDEFKLEIRCNEEVPIAFGTHIKIIGQIRYSNAQLPYIMVDNKNDISIISKDIISLENLAKANTIPKANNIKKEC